jgi:alkylation response protein AidB-like acyl-CoA dehydrogenase
MDMKFPEGDLAFQAEVRSFIDRHWPAEVRRARATVPVHGLDRTAEEQAWFDALIARGWSVPNWPVEHGGTDWTPTQRFIWDRETVRAETPQMSVFGVTMLGPILCRWGSPEQQEKFLPPIREARVQWCQGYSEPGAGSDLASLKTTARLDGDQYTVDGEKTWTSGAHLADWMFCLARTSPTGKPQEGISFLLVDMRSPGIEVRPIEILGGQHSVNSVRLEGVRVPVAHRVGEENQGWTYAKALLSHERTGVARVATSAVQLDRVREIAAAQDPNAEGLWEDAGFQRRYRELEIELIGLEMLELRILADLEAGQVPGPESSILKIRGTEIGQRINELMVEALGYYALPYPDELLIDNEGPVGHDHALAALKGWLFSRSWSIYGGSNEVQKNIIARRALGL